MTIEGAASHAERGGTKSVSQSLAHTQLERTRLAFFP
jgi:hypothetical protein